MSETNTTTTTATTATITETRPEMMMPIPTPPPTTRRRVFTRLQIGAEIEAATNSLMALVPEGSVQPEPSAPAPATETVPSRSSSTQKVDEPAHVEPPKQLSRDELRAKLRGKTQNMRNARNGVVYQQKMQSAAEVLGSGGERKLKNLGKAYRKAGDPASVLERVGFQKGAALSNTVSGIFNQRGRDMTQVIDALKHMESDTAGTSVASS